MKFAPKGSTRRRGTWVALFFCSAAAFVPNAALAQRGGAQLTRRIDVDAAVRVQYDTNVALNDPQISGGGSRGDASASPSLNANIFLPRASGDFYLNGSLGYNFYRRYTRLNRESLRLTTGADQRVGSCVVHGELGYTRQLTDLTNLVQGTAGSSVSNTEELRNYAADVGCDTPLGVRPSVAVTRNEVRNNRSVRQFADSDMMSYTGQIGYRVNALGTISIFGRHADIKYPNRIAPDGRTDGVQTYAAGAQLERSVGSRLTFVGSVNYTKVDPKLTQTRSFSGVGFDASATYRGDLFALTLTGSRAAQPSQLLFVAYDIQTALGATLERQLSQRIRLSLAARHLRREFAPSSVFTGAPPRGSDRLLTLSSSLGYRATQRLKFVLDAAYQKRTSNTQLFNFNSTRVAVTTSLSL